MKKQVGRKVVHRLAALFLLGFMVAAPQAMWAQDHVVSQADLQNAVSGVTSARQLHEQQLKSFLAMPQMQSAMKARGIDPHQVTKAVDQLSNAELARLAAKSQKAQQGFAAGSFGLGIFTLIGIIVVVAILVGVFA